MTKSPDWIDRPIDLLLGYAEGMQLPKASGYRDKQWHPEDAWHVRPDEETHWFWIVKNVRQTKWRHLATKIKRVDLKRSALQAARKTARRILELFMNTDDLSATDKARAEEALSYAVVVIRDKDASPRDGLTAAKLILEFTRAKPASKSEVTVTRAEDFLAAIEDEAAE